MDAYQGNLWGEKNRIKCYKVAEKHEVAKVEVYFENTEKVRKKT